MEIAIRNKKILAKLDEFLSEFKTLSDIDPGIVPSRILESYPVTDKQIDDVEWYASRERHDQWLKMPEKMNGAPLDYRAIPVGHLSEFHYNIWGDFYKYWRYEFGPEELGVASCALMNYYPEKGLTGWHTNWDANAYQLLLTWSEDGDGYFEYLDLKTNEIVRVQDVPGWQARWYYFARKDETEHHCWHACYTNSPRFTMAFKFSNGGLDKDTDAGAQKLRDLAIAELMSDEE